MIVKDAAIQRIVDKPGEGWRAVLLHGPDDAGSRALADRVGAAVGADAERIDLDGATLKEDPARLPDEATAMTMFGGPRWIRVTGGDEIVRAVEALLDAPQGCPVAIVAGRLTKASVLLKLATATDSIPAFASYVPDGAKADQIALQIARAGGVRLSNEAARLVAEGCGGDRALIGQEIEKLALYVDAGPDRPRPVEVAHIEAIGASVDSVDTNAPVNALFGGRPAMLGDALDQGGDMIPLLRGVARRALLLARLQSGNSAAFGQTRGLPRAEQDAVQAQQRRWSAAALASVHARVMRAEAAIKATGTAGDVIAQQELIEMARRAERLR